MAVPTFRHLQKVTGNDLKLYIGYVLEPPPSLIQRNEAFFNSNEREGGQNLHPRRQGKGEEQFPVTAGRIQHAEFRSARALDCRCDARCKDSSQPRGGEVCAGHFASMRNRLSNSGLCAHLVLLFRTVMVARAVTRARKTPRPADVRKILRPWIPQAWRGDCTRCIQTAPLCMKYLYHVSNSGCNVRSVNERGTPPFPCFSRQSHGYWRRGRCVSWRLCSWGAAGLAPGVDTRLRQCRGIPPPAGGGGIPQDPRPPGHRAGANVTFPLTGQEYLPETPSAPLVRSAARCSRTASLVDLRDGSQYTKSHEASLPGDPEWGRGSAEPSSAAPDHSTSDAVPTCYSPLRLESCGPPFRRVMAGLLHIGVFRGTCR